MRSLFVLRAVLRAVLLAVLLAVLFLTAPRAALADSPAEPEIAYSVVALEVAIALRFTVGWGRATEGAPLAATIVAGVAAPVAAGLLAHSTDLDPRPARAVHGAGMVGLSMFLAGALIDGGRDAWHLRVGPTALVLGGVGAIAGGIYGASQVSDDLVWLAGPALGMAGGFVLIGTSLVFIGGVDGDDAPGQWALGAVIGGLIGTGVAAFLMREGGSGEVGGLVPSVDVGDKRTMVSFGGQF